MAIHCSSWLLVLVLLVAVSAPWAYTYAHESSSNDLPFTNKNFVANPFGSCPLVKGYPDSGVAKDGYGALWQFQSPPCGYPSITCMQDQHMDCGTPWPNTNIYHSDETIIATFNIDSYMGKLGGKMKLAECPQNYTQFFDSDSKFNETKSFDCPMTCFDCAGLCQAQASSVSKADTFHDPTLQGCNAWVFCTNPSGCTHAGITTEGLTCTLKRIPLDNPDMQKKLIQDADGTPPSSPPAGLVDKDSSGKGSDFVSGFCNVRQTCTNNATITCESGCGNCISCYGYPMQCGGPCCPSCPC